MGQINIAKTFRKDPRKLQTLLTARSGIWYGLAILDKQVEEKSKKARLGDTLNDSQSSMDDIFYLQLLLFSNFSNIS